MARSRACHTARHLHTRLRDAAHPGSLDNLTRGSRTGWQATVVTAIARELAAFMWAIAREVPGKA